jgi:general stress protein CsbA
MAIWGYAFGYFAAYVPYSALTKALSDGKLPGIAPVDGFSILPLSVFASLVGMLVFISAMGWWQYAPKRQILGVSVPWANRWTFLSGLCTATVIMTTTLAYTFTDVSIVFVMLLMRGGMLILAPIVDKMTGRHVRWFSWAGLALSMAALVVAFAEKGGFAISLVCAIDVVAYLAAYFVRLRFMSRLAKSDDDRNTLSYFVQEQMVATPALVLALAAMALVGQGEFMGAIRAGFTEVPFSTAAPYVLVVGILSQGTGVFGSLIFLDKRENTYCVPVNRCSSILAGVVASYWVHWWLGVKAPSTANLVGAAMIIGAILFLTIPPMMERRRAVRLA